MISYCREFSWQGVHGAGKDIPEAELKRILESVAWRRVKEEWSKDLEKKPKLLMIRRLVEYGEESSCAVVKSKRERRVMLKLRGSTVAFQMETGRWQGMKRENRVCKECNSGAHEVEDVTHWLLKCPAWTRGAIDSHYWHLPSPAQKMKDRQLICQLMHVETITF